MNTVAEAYKKAVEIKRVESITRYGIAENILCRGIEGMLRFIKEYKGKNVNRSPERTKPVEEAVASICDLYGKRDVQLGKKFIYKGNLYGDGHNRAFSSYTPDVVYKDVGYFLDVFSCIEIRCGMDSLIKNKQNNTTNLLGRSQIFNAVMQQISGLSNRNWFSAATVLESSKLSTKDINSIINEYLLLYELGIPNAVIFYENNGKILLRNDLIPDELKLNSFLWRM